MDNINNTYTCKDCQNYVPYYIKQEDFKMRRIGHGYCKGATKQKQHSQNEPSCKRFALSLDANKPQSESLRGLLNDILKNVEGILQAMHVD